MAVHGKEKAKKKLDFHLIHSIAHIAQVTFGIRRNAFIVSKAAVKALVMDYML